MYFIYEHAVKSKIPKTRFGKAYELIFTRILPIYITKQVQLNEIPMAHGQNSIFSIILQPGGGGRKYVRSGPGYLSQWARKIRNILYPSCVWKMFVYIKIFVPRKMFVPLIHWKMFAGEHPANSILFAGLIRQIVAYLMDNFRQIVSYLLDSSGK